MTPDAEKIIAELRESYTAVAIKPGELLPDTLYHYTSARGLYGILTSGVMRASNFSYLNDATEIRYGSGVVRDALRGYPDERSGEARKTIEITAKLLDEVDSHLEFYLSCFCREPDLLSQWRGYGSSAGRFCIAFNTEKLSNETPRLSHLLDGVIYDAELQISRVKAVIDRALEAIQNASNLEPDDRKACSKEVCLSLIERLIEVFCFFKHRGFREEKEWRAVHQLEDATRIQFEPVGAAIRPFVELFTGVGEQRLLPIREIIVGASTLSQQARKSVQLLLDKQGYSNITVTESDVPFRDL